MMLSHQKYTGMSPTSIENPFGSVLKQLATQYFPLEELLPSTSQDNLLIWSVRKCREHFASLNTTTNANINALTLPLPSLPPFTGHVDANAVSNSGNSGDSKGEGNENATQNQTSFEATTL